MAKKVLIHIGTGEERNTYTFDEEQLLNTEAMAMEVATGRGLLEIVHSLPQVSMISVTAVVWILRRREEPGLQFEDVQFAVKDLDVEPVYPAEDAGPKEAGPEEEVPAPS